MSTLFELFEIGSARDPEHWAVRFDDGANAATQLSYRQLVDATNTV